MLIIVVTPEYLLKMSIKHNKKRIPLLKRTWGESNNFCLKWSFFIIKQNGIYKKLQKITFQPQLTYFICSIVCMTSHTLRYSFFIKNFATSYVCEKWSKKPYRRFFLYEMKKKNAKKTNVEMFWAIAVMVSLTLNSKLSNFITCAIWSKHHKNLYQALSP